MLYKTQNNSNVDCWMYFSFGYEIQNTRWGIWVILTFIFRRWICNHFPNMNDKFLCPHCEYKVTQKGNLQTHIKSVHEGQKFLCRQCGSKFTQKGHLQNHINSVNEGQNDTAPVQLYSKVIELWRCYSFFIQTTILINLCMTWLFGAKTVILKFLFAPGF